MSSDPRWSANTVDLLAGHLLDPRRDRWGKQNPDAQQLYRERAVGVLGLLAEAGLLRTPSKPTCGDQAPILATAVSPPVFCALMAGHLGWHVAEDGMKWTVNPDAPSDGGREPQGDEPTAARVWAMPEIPDDVTAVVDRDGDIWNRDSAYWWVWAKDTRNLRRSAELVYDLGPLRAASYQPEVDGSKP